MVLIQGAPLKKATHSVYVCPALPDGMMRWRAASLLLAWLSVWLSSGVTVSRAEGGLGADKWGAENAAAAAGNGRAEIESAPGTDHKEHRAPLVDAAVLEAEASNGCIVCPQVLPICSCSDPADCRYVKQSCRRCAHFVCASRRRSKTVAPPPHWTTTSEAVATGDGRAADAESTTSERYCILCWPGKPPCHCSPNQRCVIRPRTCHRCAQAECHNVEDEGLFPTQ